MTADLQQTERGMTGEPGVDRPALDHFCLDCRQNSDETAFRRCGLDGWMPRCAQCHEIDRWTNRVTRTAARQEESRDNAMDTFGRFTSIAVTTKRYLPAWRQMAELMMEKFGGVERFVDQWFAQIQYVLQEKKGTPLALQQFQTVKNLVKAAREEERIEIDVTSMGDKELEAFIEHQVQRRAETMAAQMVEERLRLIEEAAGG